MHYENIEQAVFLERPNRFVAHVKKQEQEIVCHVKNTGRCRELLIPGVDVFIQKAANAARKTPYDLVAVRKGNEIVNIDSQAPNGIVRELLEAGRLLDGVTAIRPETKHGNSRFDFYVETEDEKWFIEVKGVTLEVDGTALFPDAPTERGIRHMRELMDCMKDGYKAMICFIIQMKGVHSLRANAGTHPEFAEVLKAVKEAGVKVCAFDCRVTEDSLNADLVIPVLFGDEEVPVKAYGLKDTAEPLLEWFQGNARILPWREEATPYRVWISEIMLQQTRVEAVKPYFERFLKKLPDMKSLSEVEDDQLMKLWEGLGYYNRARNLKKTAEIVMDRYEGNMPADYRKLKELPGIGSYTAGAVASIAYGIPVPAVDGNVLRVWSRLFMCEDDVLKQSVKAKAEAQFLEAMPEHAPGAYNQALMELGATVCVPNGMAKCEECPLAFMCRARENSCVLEYPKKAGKKPRRIEERTVFVIRCEDKTVIGRRPDKGLLAGLYELPNIMGHCTQEEALEYVKQLGFSPIRIMPLTEAKHIFSHVEWHMKGFVIRVEDTDVFESERMMLIDPKETEEKYPIPTAFQSYTEYLDIKIGYEVHKS